MFTFLLFGGVPLILLPPKMTSPLSGSTKPPMMRRVVVLPQPDGPRIVYKFLFIYIKVDVVKNYLTVKFDENILE